MYACNLTRTLGLWPSEFIMRFNGTYATRWNIYSGLLTAILALPVSHGEASVASADPYYDAMAAFLQDLEPTAENGYESSDEGGATAAGVSQLQPAVQRFFQGAARDTHAADSMKQFRQAGMEIWAGRLRSVPCLEERRSRLCPQLRGYRPAYG